jgi:IclR family transcriptional regulator, KDG regulon repressor
MAKSSYDVPAVRKAIRLLELLCESPEPLGITEIGRRLDLNKNMVFRLVRTLCDEGWLVVENETTYRVGLLPFHHLSKSLRHIDLVAAAEGPVRELWEKTGEGTYFSIRDNDRVVGLIHHNSRREVMVAGRVGGRFLLHCGAPGKVLLAHAERSLFDKLAKEGFSRQTDRTICNPKKLRHELDQVVKLGHAIDREEYLHGMLCYAVPVLDHNGSVVASVGITTLTLFHSVESMVDELGPIVNATGEKISRTLGFKAE